MVCWDRSNSAASAVTAISACPSPAAATAAPHCVPLLCVHALRLPRLPRPPLYCRNRIKSTYSCIVTVTECPRQPSPNTGSHDAVPISVRGRSGPRPQAPPSCTAYAVSGHRKMCRPQSTTRARLERERKQERLACVRDRRAACMGHDPQMRASQADEDRRYSASPGSAPT
jgi:hypothetical protein